MKKFSKFILGILAVSLAIVSCEDNDKDPMKIHTNEALKAAYVRVDVNQRIYLVEEIQQPTATFAATVDVPAPNVASYDLEFTLDDGSTDYDTIPLTTITTFPAEIAYTYAELSELLGITSQDLAGGNLFKFFGTATGTDGSVWTNSNFSASITVRDQCCGVSYEVS